MSTPDDDEGMAEGVMYPCPSCGHPDWFHPEMVGTSGAVIWCAECAHPFGTWEELRPRIFTADAMLAETLSKKP